VKAESKWFTPQIGSSGCGCDLKRNLATISKVGERDTSIQAWRAWHLHPSISP